MNNFDSTGKKSDRILSTQDLSAAIKRMERKRMMMEEDLNDRFHNLLEGLKPANLLKNTLNEVQQSLPLKHNLLKVALGLGAGYFSRKLVVGKSAGFIHKALGAALQFGITHLVAKKNNGGDENTFSSRPKNKNLIRKILSL